MPLTFGPRGERRQACRYWDPWVKRQRAKRSQRQISASREDLLDQHPDKSPKAIGIRRLDCNDPAASPFASQPLGGDLARPLTARRLDTPSGIRLEVRL